MKTYVFKRPSTDLLTTNSIETIEQQQIYYLNDGNNNNKNDLFFNTNFLAVENKKVGYIFNFNSKLF